MLLNNLGIQYFPKNVVGRDFVVGDIHGMFSVLEEELSFIEFDTSVDRLFAVGDLIDRGPQSCLFLEWLEKPWFHSVKGNHEQMLIGHYQEVTDLKNCHLANGGTWYSKKNLQKQKREKMYKTCLSLPYIIEVETSSGCVGIIHADTGWEEDWNAFKCLIRQRHERTRNTCLWSRHRVLLGSQHFIKGVSKIYAGHSPDTFVRSYGNLIVIDTGASLNNGHFTILRIND